MVPSDRRGRGDRRSRLALAAARDLRTQLAGAPAEFAMAAARGARQEALLDDCLPRRARRQPPRGRGAHRARRLIAAPAEIRPPRSER